MKVLKKYNLELLTLIMAIMIVTSIVFFKDLSTIQKIMISFMILFTLHEWEENRFPGGFAKLMAKLFGLDITKEKEEMSHIPVAILLIVITFVPFFLQNGAIALIPAFLGILEATVHIIGIKIHKMKKPYTPGLVTALFLLCMSIYTLIIFNNEGVTSGSDYIVGILCMLICFAIMQRTVLAIFGLGYRDVISNIKEKFKK